MKDEELSSSLRGKQPGDLGKVVQRILDADRRGSFALTLDERQSMLEVIRRARERRAFGEPLIEALNRVVRRYETPLIARAGNPR